MQQFFITTLTSAVIAVLVVCYLPYRMGVDDNVAEQNNRANIPLSHVNKASMAEAKFQEDIGEKIAALITIQTTLSQQIADVQSKMFALETDYSNAVSEEYDTDTESIYRKEYDIAIGENNTDTFQEATDQMYLEQFDSSWDAQMHNSFEAIDARITKLNAGTIRISDSQCRSNTCRVEFTHGDKRINQSIMSALIAAPGSKSVLLKHINDGGISKTIAIYQR